MRKQKLFAVLPTMLTLGNAACGFGAITLAAKVGPESLEGNTHMFVAALLIYLGMIFDMFDGQVARWTQQTSEFGAELDSLCDAITFGVAPAFLMLQFCPEYRSRGLWVIALLFAMSAVLRLARFNAETGEEDAHEHFSGLPSPAAAGAVAAFPISVRGVSGWEATQTGALVIDSLQVLVPLVTLVCGVLMVSRIRYPHVLNQLLRGQRSREHVLILVFASLFIFLVKELALPLLFCGFALYPPLRTAWSRRVRFWDLATRSWKKPT